MSKRNKCIVSVIKTCFSLTCFTGNIEIWSIKFVYFELDNHLTKMTNINFNKTSVNNQKNIKFGQCDKGLLTK